jgi:tRNA (guanine6-N2)-methyltransferase
MKTFASTFAAGLKDVVKEMLIGAFPEVKILLELDGLIVFRGTISTDQLKTIRFANNSFVVLRMFQDLRDDPITEMLAAVLKDENLKTIVKANIGTKKRRAFRLIASRENQFVSIDQDLRNALERNFTKIHGLTVDRGRPDTEFWLLYRSEGYGFFLFRLTQQPAFQHVLEKGELGPEIAYTLCYLSEPNNDDIFLDPFCGYGSIPLERAVSFPYNMIFAFDNDPGKKRLVRSRVKESRIKGMFIVKTENALNMKTFEDGFVHKIVTDPPWGFYKELPPDIDNFHSSMLEEFCRVLKRDGILVILTARKEEFEQALSTYKHELRLVKKLDILVSGKKAAIYKVRR